MPQIRRLHKINENIKKNASNIYRYKVNDYVLSEIKSYQASRRN